jgi:hypothetical protein
VRACTRLLEAAKALIMRDHVRCISGPSTLLNTDVFRRLVARRAMHGRFHRRNLRQLYTIQSLAIATALLHTVATWFYSVSLSVNSLALLLMKGRNFDAN